MVCSRTQLNVFRASSFFDRKPKGAKPMPTEDTPRYMPPVRHRRVPSGLVRFPDPYHFNRRDVIVHK